MEEGGFVGWLKKEGEQVKAGEALYTLEGDKATQDVEAVENGILRLAPDAPRAGTPVKVGRLLGYLLTSDALEKDARVPGPLQPPTSPGPVPASDARNVPSASVPVGIPIPDAAIEAVAGSASFDSARVRISPRALRTAAALNVDWTRLRGSGRTGRIREQDVLTFAAQASSGSAAEAPPREPEAPRVPTVRLPAQVPPGTVVFTDWTFPDLSLEEGLLKPLGLQITARQCKTEAGLIALVSEADCVITQFARLNATVIAAMKRARAIVRYGIGVDNIDLDAARAHGIPVANVPDYCIDEVADQTLAFILALTRQVVPYHAHVASGKWGLVRPVDSMHALSQLTVGVVGLGRIGREVVRRLLAFNCRVLVYDPGVPAAAIQAARAQPTTALGELLAASDIVTLHCPSTAQTRKMFDAATLAQLKHGARLVNVARGDLIDTPALLKALESGRLAGAALDVCDPEPLPSDHPLLKLPHVILAPHVASVSAVAVRTLRETVATLAAMALADGLPPNVVNGVTQPRAILTPKEQ
jgi:D-3-phosphoglycerate dehydrogenase